MEVCVSCELKNGTKGKIVCTEIEYLFFRFGNGKNLDKWKIKLQGIVWKN